MPRTVSEWLLHLQRNNDLDIAEEAASDILFNWTVDWRVESVQHILNLLTAVRLDQMAKENSA